MGPPYSDEEKILNAFGQLGDPPAPNPFLNVAELSASQPAPNPHASPEDTQKFGDAMRATEELRDCSPIPDMQAACDVAREAIAHDNRNYWQDGLAPGEGPPPDYWGDLRTGLTWHNSVADHMIGHAKGYHDGEDCARATGPLVDAYRDDPTYQHWLQDLQASAPSVVGPYGTEPGVQACYDQQTHELTTGGTFDAQTPGSPGSVAVDWAFNPSHDEPYWVHQALDEAPHHAFGGDAAYVTYDAHEAVMHDLSPVDSFSGSSGSDSSSDTGGGTDVGHGGMD